jgi:hypothetical protein
MLQRSRVGVVLLLGFGCIADEVSSTSSELDLAQQSGDCPPGQIFCDEVEGKPSPVGKLTGLTLDARELTPRGDQVILFSDPTTVRWSVKLVVDFEAATGATYASVFRRAREFRIITDGTASRDRSPSGVVVLDGGTRDLQQLALIETLEIEVTRGQTTLGGGGLELVDAGSGAALAQFGFDVNLTATPGTCLEHALVRFGPIPWNMPPLHIPEIEECSESRCISITEGWIRAHHHAWRINQMFSVLNNASSTYRSFLWGQPAIDSSGDAVGTSGSSTSPEYWFGGYSDERYWAAREGVIQMLDVFVTAKTVGSNIHLKCGSCSGYGKHTTIGWINVCPAAFADGAGLYDNDQDAVTHTVLHEAMHWLWVDFDAGPRAIRDTITHGHGSACNSDIDTNYVDTLNEVRHLATYVASDGEGCWHRNLVIQTVEAYARFAMRIGEGVRDGELYQWPKLADPTPQPPSCVGEEGCLCDEVPSAGPAIPPDGDYSIDHYCGDHDGEMTCVETAVNAGAIVGICTKCDPVRGPGCECDLQSPCDVGSCWGDDTWDGGIGHCYDDPPSWACLADCERLFNDGLAYCYNDHYGGARCMDSDCPPWVADDCYQDGMVCRYGDCVVECASVQDCADLGYPSYFECSSAGRCEYPF